MKARAGTMASTTTSSMTVEKLGAHHVEIHPAPDRRLSVEVPDCDLRWENGTLRLFLPQGRSLIVGEVLHP